MIGKRAKLISPTWRYSLGEHVTIKRMRTVYECQSEDGECEDECNCEEVVDYIKYLVTGARGGDSAWVREESLQILHLPNNFTGESEGFNDYICHRR